MIEKDPVVSALKNGLEAAPNSTDLLLALASHLLQTGNCSEALGYFQQLLVLEPANVEAIEGALKCAEEQGNSSLVAAYQKLLEVLKPKTISVVPDDIPQRQTGATLKLVSNNGEQEQNLDELEAESSDITLSDVAGMQDVKKRLNRAFLAPLKNPELIKQYGKTLGGGLMLYGPPGCGKSYIAKALAGEIGARFFNVGLTDVLDMYIGNSEQKLHALFETARRSAPAVIFFDELDAIGQKRSHLKSSGMRNVVNQLLMEMDGTNTENENLFILGATNHPWDVDNALRRSGRFDRVVAVFPPDADARRHIVLRNLAEKPTDGIDIDSLVARTEGFSGADLKHLCDSAAENAIEAAISSGEVKPISQFHLEQVLREIKPTTRDWFESARNFALFANQSGNYDELLAYMKEHKL